MSPEPSRAMREAQDLAGALGQWWQAHDACRGCPVCSSLAGIRRARPAQLTRVLGAAYELLTACADLGAEFSRPDVPADPRPSHTVGVPDRCR